MLEWNGVKLTYLLNVCYLQVARCWSGWGRADPPVDCVWCTGDQLYSSSSSLLLEECVLFTDDQVSEWKGVRLTYLLTVCGVHVARCWSGTGSSLPTC